MAGRYSRARLLAPSFLVMTGAFSCGQSGANGSAGHGGAGSPSGTAGAGGAAGSSGSGASSGSSGFGGSLGISGAPINPPCVLAVCPEQPPAQADLCMNGGVFCTIWPACDYVVAGCQEHATCDDGHTWHVAVAACAQGGATSEGGAANAGEAGAAGAGGAGGTK